MSMFQNRRRVFLLIYFLVSIQALFYIFTLQTKKINPNVFALLGASIPNQPSYKQNSFIQHSNINISNSNLLQTTHNSVLISTNLTYDLTLNNGTIINTTTTTTTLSPAIVIPFSNATFYPSFNLTQSEQDNSNSLPICNFSVSNNDTTIYKVAINKILYPYEVLEQQHGSDLYPGGHYIPKQCRSEQRLALIICYRNREQHLKIFLDNIHPFLKKQQLDYTIFVVNQDGYAPFNRAALFNVGYLEAMKLYAYDCFIFHDADLLPEDLRNVYKCEEQPRHMSVAVDIMNYKLPYPKIFGGATAFRPSDFVTVNGYPTVYWGWGGEDDDMYARVMERLKKSIIRYPVEIARYQMIRTYGHTSGKVNPYRIRILSSKYNYSLDGINTANYTLNNLTFYKLFTLVNVTLKQEFFGRLRNRLRVGNM